MALPGISSRLARTPALLHRVAEELQWQGARGDELSKLCSNSTAARQCGDVAAWQGDDATIRDDATMGDGSL